MSVCPSTYGLPVSPVWSSVDSLSASLARLSVDFLSYLSVWSLTPVCLSRLSVCPLPSCVRFMSLRVPFSFLPACLVCLCVAAVSHGKQQGAGSNCRIGTFLGEDVRRQRDSRHQGQADRGAFVSRMLLFLFVVLVMMLFLTLLLRLLLLFLLLLLLLWLPFLLVVFTNPPEDKKRKRKSVVVVVAAVLAAAVVVAVMVAGVVCVGGIVAVDEDQTFN